MFQDILNSQALNNSQLKNLQESLIFTHPHQISLDSEVLSMHDDYQDFHIQSINKQSAQETKSFATKSEKDLKQKKKRIRKYTSSNPNNKKGHWTLDQNLKYHYFLELNARYFIDSERRKIDKVFKSMADFIESRQAHQCRSHHQKIQKKWGSFPNILLNLRTQNFKKTEHKIVLKELEKIGIYGHQIFDQEDLKNEQQLYRKIVEQNECSQHKIQQNNFVLDTSRICHKANCMCLMMSQEYEDQLNI